MGASPLPVWKLCRRTASPPWSSACSASKPRCETLRSDVARRPGATKARRRWALPEFKSEDVIARVGIALLLVGVAFLLKWTIDRGWLSIGARVGGTALLGALLLGAGLALRRRRGLGEALAGGGLAILYSSIFAAFQLYGLIGAGTALVVTTVLTAGAFALALRTQSETLAVVAVLGALGAPVVLYRERGSLEATLGFVALVVGGGLGVYARTRWRWLLGALVAGAWGALAVLRWKAGALPGGERAWFTATLVGVLGGTLALPLRLGAAGADVPRLPALAQPRALALWLPPVAFALLVGSVWDAAPRTTALVLLALVPGALYFARAGASDAVQREAARFGALVLAATAAVLGLNSLAAPGVVVAVAVAGALWARREAERSLRIVADAAVLGAALWEIGAVFLRGGDGVQPHRGALLLGAVVALGALGYAGLGPVALGRVRRFYLLAGHFLALVTVRALAAPLPATTAFVDGVWGLYAVGLLVAGLRRGQHDVRLLGLGTLTLTIAKLLVVDLPGVPTVWRVVIFLGLGALLLAVSFFAPHLLRGADGRSTSAPNRSDDASAGSAR